MFCLSVYIPFSYTYAHPNLDTLYFTRKAGCLFLSQTHHMHSFARAPLYPIALLDRVALEINTTDLPDERWRDMLPCLTVDCIKEAMQMFGFPKKLLLVREFDEYRTNAVARGRVRGWEGLEIREHTLTCKGTLDDEIVEFVEKALRKRQKHGDDWLAHGLPEIDCIDVEEKEGNPTSTTLAKVKQLEGLAAQTAREWLDAEQKGGKVIYDLWDTAKRLRRAGIKLPSEWGLDS
jgi:hypothetical protein